MCFSLDHVVSRVIHSRTETQVYTVEFDPNDDIFEADFAVDEVVEATDLGTENGEAVYQLTVEL